MIFIKRKYIWFERIWFCHNIFLYQPKLRHYKIRKGKGTNQFQFIHLLSTLQNNIVKMLCWLYIYASGCINHQLKWIFCMRGTWSDDWCILLYTALPRIHQPSICAITRIEISCILHIHNPAQHINCILILWTQNE